MTKKTAIAVPASSAYGAYELKESAKRNTLEAFVAALAFITVLMLVYVAFISEYRSRESKIELLPPIKGDIRFYPDKPTNPLPKLPSAIYHGISSTAGNPVPVPETLIKGDNDFASINDIGHALPTTGTDNELVSLNSDVNLNNNPVDVSVRESEIPPDTFVAVEKEPYINLDELQRMVVYPKLAIAAGVQGKVIVRVFVNIDGKPLKSIVESSENELLNEAAVKAVLNSVFTPAIQNGKPVGLWVSIPIQFRLK